MDRERAQGREVKSVPFASFLLFTVCRQAPWIRSLEGRNVSELDHTYTHLHRHRASACPSRPSPFSVRTRFRNGWRCDLMKTLVGGCRHPFFFFSIIQSNARTARILTDLNLVDTEVGVLTIGSAAIDDAVAWCLLILVISILHSTSMITALYVFLVVCMSGKQPTTKHIMRLSSLLMSWPFSRTGGGVWHGPAPALPPLHFNLPRPGLAPRHGGGAEVRAGTQTNSGSELAG